MNAFDDRTDAGRQLGELLKRRGVAADFVLGIPRGGVPVAAEVARALGARLGVVVARKLGAPWQSELAIGAVAADGSRYLNQPLADEVGADELYIRQETERQVEVARRREEEFHAAIELPLEGKRVVVVDDGLATGATAIAALRSTRRRKAARVTLAVPVGAPDAAAMIGGEADEVICLAADPYLHSVGQYYMDFRPVSEEEALDTIRTFDAPAAPGEDLSATVSRDGVSLAVRLIRPAAAGPVPAVVFVHGLGSSKESPRNLVIAERLRDVGVASVLFDLNGHGESSRDPRGERVGYVADLEAVWQWVSARCDIDPSRVGVSGSSLGGVVALDALRLGMIHPSVVVLRAPPVDEGDFEGLSVPATVVVGSEDPLRTRIEAEAASSGRVTLRVVPGASHLFEEPGTLAAATEQTVEAFLDGLRIAGRSPLISSGLESEPRP